MDVTKTCCAEMQLALQSNYISGDTLDDGEPAVETTLTTPDSRDSFEKLVDGARLEGPHRSKHAEELRHTEFLKVLLPLDDLTVAAPAHGSFSLSKAVNDRLAEEDRTETEVNGDTKFQWFYREGTLYRSLVTDPKGVMYLNAAGDEITKAEFDKLGATA